MGQPDSQAFCLARMPYDLLLSSFHQPWQYSEEKSKMSSFAVINNNMIIFSQICSVISDYVMFPWELSLYVYFTISPKKAVRRRT